MIRFLIQPRHARWLAVGLVASVGALLLAVWTIPRQFSPSNALSATNARWSPDGAYLAMDCAFGYEHWWDDAQTYEVCLAKPDLSDLIRIAPEQTSWRSLRPAWSPTGTELVFEDPEGGLLISGLRPGTTRVLTDASCAEPAWSPDGQQIACMSGDRTITLIDVGTGQMTQFTASGTASTPRWARNGQAIVFTKTASYDPPRYDLDLFDLALRQERRLVGNLGPIHHVTIAPDGAQLAYPSPDLTELDVQNLQTGTREDVLAPYRACLDNINDPEWSHDGHYLAFAAERRGSYSKGQIYLMDVRTRAVFQATNFAGVDARSLGTPMWSPDDAVLATDVDERYHGQESRVVVIPTSTTKLTPVSCH